MGNLSTEYFYRILNTRRDDAGNYQCVAQNDVGAIFSEKIDVTVACKYYTIFCFRFNRLIKFQITQIGVSIR